MALESLGANNEGVILRYGGGSKYNKERDNEKEII